MASEVLSGDAGFTNRQPAASAELCRMMKIAAEAESEPVSPDIFILKNVTAWTYGNNQIFLPAL